MPQRRQWYLLPILIEVSNISPCPLPVYIDTDVMHVISAACILTVLGRSNDDPDHVRSWQWLMMPRFTRLPPPPFSFKLAPGQCLPYFCSIGSMTNVPCIMVGHVIEHGRRKVASNIHTVPG